MPERSNRSASTPAGFRNLRVLIPEELHWRLRDLAIQSRMTFQRYIVSWLGEAFPLPKTPGSSGSQEVEGGALAPGLTGLDRDCKEAACGTSAAHGPATLASSWQDHAEGIPGVMPILGRQAGCPQPDPAPNLAVAEGHDHE